MSVGLIGVRSAVMRFVVVSAMMPVYTTMSSVALTAFKPLLSSHDAMINEINISNLYTFFLYIGFR